MRGGVGWVGYLREVNGVPVGAGEAWMEGGDACVALARGSRCSRDEDEGDAQHKASPTRRSRYTARLRRGHGSRTRATQASPPHVHTTPAPTNVTICPQNTYP